MAVAVAAAALALSSAPVAVAGETLAGPVEGRPLAVIDGDTIRVLARVWLGQHVEIDVRLLGVDAPELKGGCPAERLQAEAARVFVVERLGSAILLHDIRHDKFGGRVVARVEVPGTGDLGQALIAAGLARPYEGGRRRTWCVAG